MLVVLGRNQEDIKRVMTRVAQRGETVAAIIAEGERAAAPGDGAAADGNPAANLGIVLKCGKKNLQNRMIIN